jgi:site-specific DNA-methyltransferase (adenine-specific)
MTARADDVAIADDAQRGQSLGAAPCSAVQPEPFYDEDGITLYCGDARDIVPLLSDFVLVTDPPYGVAMGVDKDMRGGKHGLGKGAYHGYGDTYEEWCESVLPAIQESVKRAKRAAVFTGPHLQEQPKASAIGGIYCPAGAGRHSWGFKTLLPVLFYGTAPNLNLGAKPNTLQSSATADKNGHPCPKPLEWMLWLVNLASEPTDVILDPFAGSGTTLRAAKDLGRRAIGIEVNEAYCQIIVRQLAQGVLWRQNAALCDPAHGDAGKPETL